MKFPSPSDLLVILTSKKGLFSSKVSYQLVMDLARRGFPQCAYTVIERRMTAVENETVQLSRIRLLRLMDHEACEPRGVELCLLDFGMCILSRLP
jgi:hypothetical protein